MLPWPTFLGPYIANQHAAYCLQAKVNDLVTQFKYGYLPLPPNRTIPDFIFGSAVQKPDLATVPVTTINTMSELLTEYRHYAVPPIKNKSTCYTESIHLHHLQAFLRQQGLGDPLLPAIKVDFFKQYKQFRYRQGVRTDTVKKELGTFQCLFQFAVDKDLLPHNVVRDVKRDKSQVSCSRFRPHGEIQQLKATGNYSAKEIQEWQRFQYLNPTEVEAFIALAQGHWLHPILAIFAYTGMRRGELLRLAWADVDLTKRQFYVRSYKQSQTRQETVRCIPIHDDLLPILQAQKLKTGSHREVFVDDQGAPFKGDTWSKALCRLVSGTKFAGLGFHVFRHSFASNLAIQGVDQRVIDKLLGHTTEAMRQRYQHLFPAQMESAISKLMTVK